MGYELHITRAEGWVDSAGAPITLDEWLGWLRQDSELKLAGFNGPYFAVFADAKDPLRSSWLDWKNGEIHSKYPSLRMVRKMIALAAEFMAKVQGDEGEVYTPTELHGMDDREYQKKLGYE